MQHLKADGVPVDSPAEMVGWFSKLTTNSQSKLAAKFRDRIFEEQAKLEGVAPTAPGGPTVRGTDPDLVEFEKSYQPDSKATDNLAELKREVAFYLFKMKRSRERKNRVEEFEAANQFRHFSNLLHDCELRAQRLGRDLGESFSAAEVDRLGRAVAFWLMHGADSLITSATKALAEQAAIAPLDREGVRQAIEPLILAERVLAPLARAAAIKTPVALPARFVEALKAGVAAYVEDGAAEFAAMYGTPVPEPCAASAP